jgi:hypothetical protein
MALGDFIIHQLAQDYLQKNYESLQPDGGAQGQADISRRSLVAMSKPRQNMYNLDFGFKPEDLTPPEPDPFAPIRYSCVFWADHLLNSNSSESRKELADNGAVFSFLEEHSLHWIEILSLLVLERSGWQFQSRVDRLARVVSVSRRLLVLVLVLV